MTVYRIAARCIAQPPAPDWREQLVVRLGVRPRRLGHWGELGMYGALECLAQSAESQLTPHTALVLSSRHGPVAAVRSAMTQAGEDLPLPLTFLQTQSSQLLAALSAQLRWCGDARFVCQADPQVLLAWAIASAESHADGLLIGWVDELDAGCSVWLRLHKVADPGGVWRAEGDFPLLLRSASHLRRGSSGLEVIIAPSCDDTDLLH